MNGRSANTILRHRVASVVKMEQPVSILMPVCNEAAVIEQVVGEWVRDVFAHLPEGSEMLMDEAGSTDGTKQILEGLRPRFPFLKVHHQDRKDGFAAAARRLYLRAKCPWVFFTDSDGQYVASDFWKLAKHATRYDIIHGAKIGRKDPLPRRIFSALFNKFANFLFELHFLDINSAFRLQKKEVIDQVLQNVNCMPTLLNAEFLLRAALDNYEIKQVHILHRQREAGKSRGLPPHRYLREGAQAVKGLLLIKSSYRQDEKFD